MGKPKALSRVILPEAEVVQDRKKAKKFDLWAVGQKALYVGTSFTPRKYYIPYSAITRVFKRVAVSPGSGKAFLTPVLYMVVEYDDGKEHQSAFRYLQDADKMMDELERYHPEISLLSQKGEEEKRQKEALEKEIAARELSLEARKARTSLERARWFLEKRPSLSNTLAGVSRVKRRVDLIRPLYQAIAFGVVAIGFVMIGIGTYLIRAHGNGNVIAILLLAGFAAVFVMGNSKILPTPRKNRKALQRDYDKALTDMERYLKSESDFPLPARYAHPYVAGRMIRILQEGRAQSREEALEVLKEDLKKMDAGTSLSGDDYKEVVTIKPLFLVADYQ